MFNTSHMPHFYPWLLFFWGGVFIIVWMSFFQACILDGPWAYINFSSAHFQFLINVLVLSTASQLAPPTGFWNSCWNFVEPAASRQLRAFLKLRINIGQTGSILWAEGLFCQRRITRLECVSPLPFLKLLYSLYGWTHGQVGDTQLTASR